MVELDPEKLLNRKIANSEGVQAKLSLHAHVVAVRAERILRSGPYGDGKSKIEVDHGMSEDEQKYGHIDWFVILDDTATQDNDPKRSLSIEFGTKRSRAVAPLRKGAGLEV